MCMRVSVQCFLFFKLKTAYELRISDWSSDVCSSDLTIPPPMEAKSPGDAAMEWRIRSIIRWNAMAMVVRANRKPGDLGGHIATFGSSATLYDEIGRASCRERVCQYV